MSAVRLGVVLGVMLVVWPLVGSAQTLSRDEVDSLWEQLLREERYQGIHFHSGPGGPSIADLREQRVGRIHHAPEISVQDSREGYLGGLLGSGGGWHVRGQLEAEVPIEGGLLQLYSKETSKWSPGFAFIWMPGYDPKKYPLREFRLLLRHPRRRQEIRILRSLEVAPDEVLATENPDGTSVKELIGQRIPRGELRYDAGRKVAIVQILGLHKPITVEVPVPSPPFPEGAGQ